MGNRFYVSNTILFIPKSQVPQDQKVTYGRIVCDIKPKNAETHITRLNVGVNIIEYPCEFTTPTEDTETAKTLINNTISKPDARLLCANIANFYINTLMDHH